VARAAPDFFGAPVPAEVTDWWVRMIVDRCALKVLLDLHKVMTETDSALHASRAAAVGPRRLRPLKFDRRSAGFLRGWENVTVDDIAAAANASPRTFRNYFSTKAEGLPPDTWSACSALRTIYVCVPLRSPYRNCYGPRDGPSGSMVPLLRKAFELVAAGFPENEARAGK
jgi:hypothetical protein